MTLELTPKNDCGPQDVSRKARVSDLMISAAFGSALTSIVVTPLDVVKTRLQAQERSFSSQKCFLYSNGLWDHVCYCNGVLKNNNLQKCPWYRRPGHFNGTIDAFAKLIKNEGILTLWSGWPPTLLTAVPATMMYFTLYDQLHDLASEWLNKSSFQMWLPGVIGAFTRVAVVTLVSPIELIRTKVQSQKIKYSEIFRSVSKLMQQQGVLSLWRGWAPTIMRDVPFSAIYWSAYEGFKGYYNPSQKRIYFNFLFGATAGTVAALITFPFDVIKTHRQIEVGEASIPSDAKANTRNIMYKLYREKGFKVLYTGIAPRLIKVAPSCAIMISCYEYGKMYFIEKRKE